MTEYSNVKAMVRGTYDLQKLRIQTALRLYANFRAKLKSSEPEEEETEEGELSEKAVKLIDKLKAEYKLITAGIARNRTLPTREGFVGQELISTFPELVLVDQYLALERDEKKQFSQFEAVLDEIPIYRDYLKHIVGIGPAMGGVLIAELDPGKPKHVSGWYRYIGIDVANDGKGRSRRKEHLVEYTYKNKAGEEATRIGLTYNPWLKSKLVGVLPGNFLRLGSPWRTVYDGYKHRLETDPTRQKATVAEYKKLHKTDPAAAAELWTPGRIDKASKRYMVKIFLHCLWDKWRAMEGLPVDDPYPVAKLGLPKHGNNPEDFYPPQASAA
jgi:hypothetical protein